MNEAVCPETPCNTTWLPSSSAWVHCAVAGLASRLQPGGTPVEVGVNQPLGTTHCEDAPGSVMAVFFAHNCTESVDPNFPSTQLSTSIWYVCEPLTVADPYEGPVVLAA